MKRRPTLSLSIWFGLFILFLASCNSPVQSVGHPRPHLLQPGSVYRIAFNNPVDKYDIGTLFEHPANLSLSPLAPMYRRPVIIKADDLNARVSPNWRKFINWTENRSYSVGLGLICNSLATAPTSDIHFLKSLDRRRFELWLHGWDHEIGEQIAEFQGRSLASQKRHIDESLKWAKRKLGISLKTFGPPGNRSDELTAIALESTPQLKVWFDSGTTETVQDAIDLNWIAESTTGRLRSFDVFREKLAGFIDKEVIVLQVHPAEWDDSDLELFGRMVDHVVLSLERRIMIPYGYYKWRRDMKKLKVKKVGKREYHIDCSAAQYPHELDTIEEHLFIDEISSAKVLGE
ncbi:MAG: hypothetical protein CMG71_02240 [Candidatus Marinimicrobia bacterium]|nr:hypothetical protein [Candidatus Neomarinimicrobiota bacterium]|tara:strand:- start:2947 stop:3984 length:1038 start_codon:yes stop_codon:yes gene_type:complete